MVVERSQAVFVVAKHCLEILICRYGRDEVTCTILRARLWVVRKAGEGALEAPTRPDPTTSIAHPTTTHYCVMSLTIVATVDKVG